MGEGGSELATKKNSAHTRSPKKKVDSKEVEDQVN
jgi:hypothetical protein